MLATDREILSIVDADPDLLERIDEGRVAGARRSAVARVRRLEAGSWDAAAAAEDTDHHLGFFVVGGLLARGVEVLGRHCIELVGPGDVIRPWVWDGEGSHVNAEVSWEVLEPAAIAVLDAGFVGRIAPYPGLGIELISRGLRRAHVLAVHLAIAHHSGVSDRVLLTLWLLAERWGRVASGGIVIPLPLTHERIAHIVGARRPSVSTALNELTHEGLVSRRPNRDWVVHGEPPAALRRHRIAQLEEGRAARADA